MGNSESKNQEEIMVMSSINDMVKHFVKENAIIWHDPNIHSPENASFIAELSNICDVQVFADWKDASEYLKTETQLSCCQVITSGTNGELFAKEISCLPSVSSIYVFCGNINYHNTWASQYSKVVCVESNFERLLEKIRQNMITWQRTSSSLRVNLPSFAPIFDDIDLSEMNYLQLHLQGLVNFTNRLQGKKDFLNLARALYGKNKHIEEFETDYNEYDMKTILNWYTKECFLYRLTNNCLRVAKSDSIQYCRLILKDLETAIKDKYKKHSHKFSGPLYRGAYLSDNEWMRIQQNINREIEMHGFLSTTKQKKVALKFFGADIDKKAMITIVVPNFPDKGEQGFAEMSEYTAFPEEDEVLFNVRSRFTVLEATLEDIDGLQIRHLVLLYGAQAMRRYMTLHSPFFQVKLNLTSKDAKCKACNKKMNIDKESVIAVNICSSREYFCQDCIKVKQPHMTDKLVLLYMSLSAEKSKTINTKIEGTVIPYQESLNIPFYGDKCIICEGTKFRSCYKCLDCKDTKMIYCDNCFHDQSVNDCLRKTHLMVAQGYSFSFWSDKMSEMEGHHLNYQKEQLKRTNHLFQQGNIFYETHNYEKAIEYFKKYLEKDDKSKNEQTATSYNNLGNAYKSLGEYKKALESYIKSLDIRKAVFGDNHRNTAISYTDLGLAYNTLGEYQKAIEHLSKALDIRKRVFRDNHPETATSYNNLGNTYYELGEYQKSREYYSKSLETHKAVFGDNHPHTATSYNNLGLVFLNLEEYQKAIEYYSKSLDIRKAVFGDNHPDTAASYNNLGLVYYNLKEYQKAREYYSRSLETHKVVLGNDHPNTATCYNNLGLVYDNLREYQKAIDFYAKSLDIRKTVFGDNHPETAASYNNLGLVYYNLREYQKAIEYYSKSLEIHKVVLGGNHLKTATSYNNLGLVYDNLGEYQTAKEYYSKSLGIRKAILGDKHPHTVTSYNNLESAKKKLNN